MNLLWPLSWTAGALVAATVVALAVRRVLLAARPRWVPSEA